jgi:hypothetical protein
MQSTYCDVCRKKVDNPFSGRTFFYLAKHGICEPCKDNLEFNIRPTLRNKEPYAVDWYSKLINDSLEKGAQKGKI